MSAITTLNDLKYHRMAKKLESVYQTADAVNRRRILLEALQLQPGEKVLDIGTGHGGDRLPPRCLAGRRRYQNWVPGSPLKGPTISSVTQPP